MVCGSRWIKKKKNPGRIKVRFDSGEITIPWLAGISDL